MNKTFTPLLWVLALALFSGCTDPSSGTGSVQVTVSEPQDLSSPISRVTLVASAADFPSITQDLELVSGVWSGTLGNIPAGTERSFQAQAFDASDKMLFEGSASGITITTEQTTLVAILLQEVNPPPPFQNEAPLIESLSASATSVFVDGTISLTANARDPNTGDTLTYAWSSHAGTFSSPSTASTSWKAPSTQGIQNLTLTVTDPGGLSASAFVTLQVIRREEGNAQVSISFNRSPSVLALTASPTLFGVGQPTAVSASATDLDGDSLSYTWSADCAGTWSDATTPSARFTPSAVPAGACNNCRLTVSVSDGRGGSTRGTLALCVSSAPRINHAPPIIDSALGSSETATPGQVLTYEVTAHDPEGSPLTFSWNANTGVLGSASSNASSSGLSWTAPSCATTDTPTTLTATVTNAFGLAATHRFPVTGLPVCPSGWSSAGNLSSNRATHAATLLPNGKVLITGGRTEFNAVATAELYDPETGVWSTARKMNSIHASHTSTLLPDGTVLVTGGSNLTDYIPTAEVYEPATNTWTTVGSMKSARMYHRAVLLSNGKVLVTGGFRFGSLATAELYDPNTGSWSATGSMATARSDHSMVLLADGKVLVSGFGSVEVYDPNTGTWRTTRPPPMGSAGRAIPLADGTVLVMSEGNTAGVYDPVSDTWSMTGPMGTPRNYHTATRLPNGKVLVTGGSDSPNHYTATAELYDPVTKTWSAAGSLATAHGNHTATRLLNGKVLLTGGTSNPTHYKLAELYTP